MPKVFVFEFVSGGGAFATPGAPAPTGSLLVEGQAMASALAADFASLPDATTTTLRDARLSRASVCQAKIDTTYVTDESSLWRSFDRLAAEADVTLVVAPETDGWLVRCLERVASVGGNLLGPSLEFARVASSKSRTTDCLRVAGVPTTTGKLIANAASVSDALPWPVVVKPDGGCGSQGVRRLDGPDDLAAWRRESLEGCWRWERFAPGVACSVSALVGVEQTLVFPALAQRLSDDGHFQYAGGEGPLDRRLRERAERLAAQAIVALPKTTGWVGVDVILGEDAELDRVIEINPRVTTSYIGLRRLLPVNLAGVWLTLQEGRPVANPSPRGRVRFSSSGAVERIGV